MDAPLAHFARPGTGPERVVHEQASAGLFVRGVVRLFLVLVGGAAFAWGAATLPILSRQSIIERTAARIIDRDSFKAEALASLVPLLEQVESAPYCRPEALRSSAIVRLRLAENAMSAGVRAAIDPQLDRLRRTVELSLACAPSDAFLWMVLAWVDDARESFRPRQLRFLELSYRLGRNEGWVAVLRDRLALTMKERLPPALAQESVDEFVRLVESGFIREAVEIFAWSGRSVSAELLSRLSVVSEQRRQAFASALYAKGYDVDVPGITPREARPWR